MYIALILLAVCLFGGCFALNDVYRRQRGSSLRISLEYALLSSGAGLIVLLCMNGFRLSCTPFTLTLALLSALVSFAYTFCSFKALGTINLSVYSVFSMLGGMALPFLQGILCYAEPVTTGKVVCVALICAALLMTVQRGKTGSGRIYYAGVFVLNGLSGVLAKLFSSSPLPKAGAEDFSILTCLCTAAIALLLLQLLPWEKSPRFTLASLGVGFLSGAGNKFANYLLLIALAHVDASVQYPLVTGGVMILSTLLCFLGPDKPRRREILSVVTGFAGMLALFLIRS